VEIDKGRNVRARPDVEQGGSRGVFHPVGRLAIGITTAPPGRVVVSASLDSTSPLPRMPLAVITHGGLRYPPGSLDAAQEQLWQQLQDELAAMQPDLNPRHRDRQRTRHPARAARAGTRPATPRRRRRPGRLTSHPAAFSFLSGTAASLTA